VRVANQRGATPSWPFVAASTSLHDPVSPACSPTYQAHDHCASADRTTDEYVTNSSNYIKLCERPRRLLPWLRKHRRTSTYVVGSQMERLGRVSTSTPETWRRKVDFFRRLVLETSLYQTFHGTDREFKKGPWTCET